MAQGEIRSYWEAFYGSRPKTQTEKKEPQKKFQGSNATQQQRVPKPFENICRNWNVGRCMKPDGTCKSPLGTPLRHCCNFRTDLRLEASTLGWGVGTIRVGGRGRGRGAKPFIHILYSNPYTYLRTRQCDMPLYCYR